MTRKSVREEKGKVRMKMKKKVGAILLAAALLLQLTTGLVLGAAPEECVGHVTALNLVKLQDGSAPFDSDDERGNDQNDQNRRVRSYDTITYDLTVEVASHDQKSHKEGWVDFEVTLPTDKEVYLDHSSMAWAEDWQTTEVGDNTVTSFSMELQSHQVDGNVIPGEYTVTMVVAVRGKSEGAVIQPTFAARFKGCDEALKTCTPDMVTVTSAPNYNAVIKPGKVGSRSLYTVDGKQVSGWVMNYGVALELNTGNPDKGMRGVEIPTGDFTLDVEIAATLSDNGMTYDFADGFAPLFQTIRPSQSGAGINGIPYSQDDGVIVEKENIVYQNGNWTGSWDKESATLSLAVSGYGIDMDKVPHAAFGGSPQYVAPDGKIQIAAFSSQLFSIVLPYLDVDDASNTLDGHFSLDAGDIRCNATVKNLKLADTAITQTVAADDEANLGTSLTTKAGRNQEIFYSTWENVGEGTEGGVGSHKTKTNGSDAATLGSDLSYTVCYHENDVYVDDIDQHTTMLYQLVRFDDEALELHDNQLQAGQTWNDKWNGTEIQWIGKDEWTLRVWYAAKADGTGWTDDEELKNAKPEDLVYYETLEALKADGKICVAALHERRGYYTGSGKLFTRDCQKLYVKSDSSLAGRVYMITATTYAWTAGDLKSLIAAETLKNISDLTVADHKAYAQSHSMVDLWNAGKAAPNRSVAAIDPGPKYVKAIYDPEKGGYQANETKSFASGDSLYVIPYKTTVSKTVAQKVEAGAARSMTDKSVFSMDAKERYVDYEVAMTMAYEQGATLDGGDYPTTTVTLVDTLPKGLTYLPDSAYWGGQYIQQGTTAPGRIEGGMAVAPIIGTNADGLTTLTWVIEGVSTQPGHTPSLHFTCIIGNMLSLAEDVQGGDNLTNTVTVQTAEDMRVIAPVNGNISEVAIKITKLGSYIISKTGDFDLECFGTAQYQMAMVNTSGTIQTHLCGIDTMPFHRYQRAVVRGQYAITSMKLDLEALKTIEQKEAITDGIAFYYTHDDQYRGLDVTADEIRNNWVKAELDPVTGDITEQEGATEKLIGTWPVAWAVMDDELYPNTAAIITLTFDLTNAEPGDILINTFSEGDKSTVHTPYVYGRSITGTAWEDADADGLLEDGETRLAGVQVKLWQREELMGDYTLLKTTTTNEQGDYTFDRLLTGMYHIEFVGEELADYKVTELLVGEDTAVNSKATGVMNGDTLVSADIRNLYLPTLGEIKAAGDTLYQAMYQHVGFVKQTPPTQPTQPTEPSKPTEPQPTQPSVTDPAPTDTHPTDPTVIEPSVTQPSTTRSTAPSTTGTTDTQPTDPPSTTPATGESSVWMGAALLLVLAGVTLLFLRKKQAE